MVTANLKIIEDLKAFFHQSTTNTATRVLYSQKPANFSRNRKLPMMMVIMMILNLLKRSLSVEIQDFFDTLVHQKPPTESAFCQQRKKLKPLFFQHCNEVLVGSYYHHYGEKVRLWRNFLLLAADGTNIYLSNKKCLKDHYGTHTNQHASVAMARAVQIQDVLNGMVLWSGLYPTARSETSIVQENVQQFPPESVVLFDRYFAGFVLMYLLLHLGTDTHFVMRCRKGFTNQVKAFVRSRKRSRIIEWQPDPDAKAKLKEMGYDVDGEEPLKVRLVKFKLSSGETEVLLTDLYDESLYSVEDLKALYALRWRIETLFDKEKNKMQLEQNSGASVLSVEQDFYACVLVSNLECLMEQQCSGYIEQISACRKYRYKINTNVAMAAMKHNVVKLFVNSEVQSMLELLQQTLERNVVPIRPGRNYQRKRKMKKTKGKYQTFTNYKRAI